MDRRLLGAHRAIVLVLACFGALGILYSVTTPLFEAPDEQWHYAFVQYVATGHGLPVQTLDQPQHLARQEGSQPPLYYLLAAAATGWVDSSDYPGIVWENPHYGYNVPGIVNDNKNLFIHTSAENMPYHGAALAIHIARLLSVLMGMLAVLFTYYLTLEILPGNALLAAAAAAVAGFVPQFVFVSGAVSNDSTIVATSAFSLWMMVRLVRSESEPRLADALLLGLATGLAALAKVSGAGLVLMGAGVLVYVWLRRSYAERARRLVFDLVAFAAVVSLVVGWWYLRNLVLYGEPTGTAMMTRIFGARETPLTGTALLTQLTEVWETFWIGFGWGNIRANPWVYNALGVGVVASGVELLLGLLRRRTRLGEWRPTIAGLSVLAVWAVVVLAEMLLWMETTQAPHGRLLFPVLPALAPLVVLGAAEWFPRRLARFGAGVPAFLLAVLAAAAPFTVLQPAYAYPPFLAAAPDVAQRADLSYDGKMKLLGIDVSPDRVAPGGAVTLTLFWQSLAAMDDDYSVGIHLLDPSGQVIGARDSYPGHGLLPTRLWQPGQILRDAYWVPVSAAAPAASVVRVQVDLYSRSARTTLAAFDPQGQPTTPIAGRFKTGGAMHPAPAAQNATSFVFGGQAGLVGYDLDMAMLTLHWKRIAPMTTDYTVFVHVLDAGGKVVAQVDRQPDNGIKPTLLWDDGETVIDPYSLAVPARGTYRIELGLYRADTGERLPVSNGREVIGDHVSLGPVELGR